MPLSYSDFPSEVQVAFFMFSLLSDVWDGMSGMYMGKDWSSADFIFKTYEINNPQEILFFMKLYERELMSQRAEEAEKKRKASERKSKQSSGKQYTHNVKG
jgi:hypothetical protein